MAEQDIPEWAFARANDLTDSESAHRALARYIASRELPPVDPVQECLREAYGAAAPEFVHAFKAALAKRDLKIVDAAS